MKTAAKNQLFLNQMIQIAEGFPEGSTKTIVPFLSVIRRSAPTPVNTAVLTPSICIILRGSKKVHFGREVVPYFPGDFLASVFDMPTTGFVSGASKATPYLGLRMDFNSKEIADVVSEAGLHVKQKDQKLNPAAFVGKTDTELLELFAKLLNLIHKPDEARFMSSLIKREILFRLLRGDHGHMFLQPALFGKKADGIGKVIVWIRDNFSKPLSVTQLAKSNSMSVSALHQKFKTVTTMGPLQYQKQLRLLEARRLILSGAMDATTAALEVGYESPSQFSREYRRLFGLPPMQDTKAMRTSA